MNCFFIPASRSYMASVQRSGITRLRCGRKDKVGRKKREFTSPVVAEQTQRTAHTSPRVR